jgi:phage gp16-like protein
VKERRALLAKIHVAKKQMNMTDDDYRDILLRVAGVMSAANATLPLLRSVIEELKAKGFQELPGKGWTKGPRPASHPAARKARALWISLHHLGAIANPSEQALEAFAARQLGVERMQWVNQALMYKLVEALKAIAERNGWSQDTIGLKPAGLVLVLKRRLCDAILVKLVAAGIAPADWSLERAAWSLLGFRRAQDESALFWEMGDLDLVAAGLGRKLRAAA